MPEPKTSQVIILPKVSQRMTNSLDNLKECE